MFSKDKIVIVLVAWRGLGTSCLDVCWTAVLSEGHEEIHGVLSFHNQYHRGSGNVCRMEGLDSVRFMTEKQTPLQYLWVRSILEEEKKENVFTTFCYHYTFNECVEDCMFTRVVFCIDQYVSK